MASLKGKKSSSRLYRKLPVQDNDSELSLSEEENVVFTKPGFVKRKRYPDERLHKAKAKSPRCQYLTMCVVVAVLLVAAAVLTGIYFITQRRKPSTEDMSPFSRIYGEPQNWTLSFENMASEGTVVLKDVDGDGMDDVIFASYDYSTIDVAIAGTKMDDFDGLHRACNDIGQTYPCVGRITALRGIDGTELWSINTRSGAFVMNCEQFDINKDDKMDCIATGRIALIVAFDPFKGEVLWTCEDDRFVNAAWNIYQPARLPDWDNDGVPEVLIANGGDDTKESGDHDRLPGRLLVLSGATGQPIGHRYLNMSHSKETYMSPVLYTPREGEPTYILFGSGGETVPGDLMGISLRDFCKFILGDTAEVCVKEKETHYTGLTVDDNMKEIFIIYNGTVKGVMVPPVITDVNSDGTEDILMSTFDGRVFLYNGKDLSVMWATEFHGMETYSTPSPGYFDDDDYLDFMIHWNLGEWMTYFNSTVCVISGKDGSVLWSLQSNFMEMGSTLSLLSADTHHSAFVFRVTGRDSVFSWTKEGIVRPSSETGRKRRHGDHSNANDTSKHSEQDESEKYLTCEDDLSTFTEEIFLMDRTSLKTPSRLLQVPLKKRAYGKYTTCSMQSFGDSSPISFRNESKLSSSQNSNKPFASAMKQLSSKHQFPLEIKHHNQPANEHQIPLEDDHMIVSENEYKNQSVNEHQIPSENDHMIVSENEHNNQSVNEHQIPMASNIQLESDYKESAATGDSVRNQEHTKKVGEKNDSLIEIAEKTEDVVNLNHKKLNTSDTEMFDDDNKNSGRTATSIGNNNGQSLQSKRVNDAFRRGPRDRRKRHLDESQKMCSVEKPDSMSSGAIGDVDGDGLLDYISVLSLFHKIHGVGNCRSRVKPRTVIYVVNMEHGLLKGKFPLIPIKAQTILRQSNTDSGKGRKDRIFAALSEQKWTRYMGAQGNNWYR